MAHPGGRPTKYNAGIVKKVDEYLAQCGDKIEEYHKTRGEKSDTYERIVSVNLPKIQGFAQYIDINLDTIAEWEKKYPEFSVALDKIRVAQHNMVIDGAVSGRYSPVISKLILSNNHGYREKSDVTSDGKGINLTFDNAFTPSPEKNSK